MSGGDVPKTVDTRVPTGDEVLTQLADAVGVQQERVRRLLEHEDEVRLLEGDSGYVDPRVEQAQRVLGQLLKDLYLAVQRAPVPDFAAEPPMTEAEREGYAALDKGLQRVIERYLVECEPVVDPILSPEEIERDFARQRGRRRRR